MDTPKGRRRESDAGSDRVHLATAFRRALAAGYGARDLRRDVLAGLVVGVVALPLSMALAIATGVPPQHGLYTAIVAGAIVALLGGSPTQISGPTAAFVVVLVPITSRFGLAGLAVATVLAGLMLVAFGVMRLGRLIQYIPYPVTSGFTAGIGVVIAVMQLKDFLGLQVTGTPHHFFERAHAIGSALPTLHVADAAVGALTLGVLILWPRLTKAVPAPLVALCVGGAIAALLPHVFHGASVATVGSRFSYELGGATHAGIPRMPPTPTLPWLLAGPHGQPLAVSWHLVRELVPSAFAIAMLGAIESLLSAVVADGMAGTHHDPDAELVGQGVGNIIAPFFGGFAATGAIARTATNIRSGGKTPVAALTHALFVLAAMLSLAPLLSYLPMASLAALLLVVAYNMSEVKHFVHIVRIAPKSDVAVQLTCFGLTVAFDMVVAVTAGVLMAALLFMRRMVETTSVKVASGTHPALHQPLPDGVVLYEIGGPLFFGAAQKAMSELELVSQVRAVILDMHAVPAMDVTGLVNLESSLERLASRHVLVVMVGVQPQPARVLARAGIVETPGAVGFVAELEDAVELAGEFIPPAPGSWRGARERTPTPAPSSH